MPNLTLAQHEERLKDGTTIVWPATQGNSLAFSGGEIILGNRGTQLSYVSSDGLTTITFGAFLNGTSFSGTTTGTSPNQWDGPYGLIDKSAGIDLDDPAFHDIEKVGDINDYPEADGQYAVYLDSGDLVFGSGIAPNAITLDHHHASSTATGHFTGGTPKIDTTVIPKQFYFSMTSPNKALRFKTDNGDGDILTRAGGFAGAYAIGASQNGAFGGDMANTFGPIISEYQAGPAYAATFPQSGIADSMISFCHYFPAEMNVPTLFSSTGGSLSSQTWSLRYCYFKSVTLDSMINSAAITSGGTQGAQTATLASVANLANGMRVFLRGGNAETVIVQGIAGSVVTFTTKIQQTGHTMAGWGNYTQTIETPLSTPADITVSSGTNTNQIQCVIPDAPTGWSGPRLYVNALGWQTGHAFVQLTNVTHYTKSGTTYTVKVVPAQSSAAVGASYGFAAWPTGTLLAKDPDAASNYLMKWAHVDSVQDANSSDYQIVTYHAGTQQQQTTGVAKSSIILQHLNTTNAPSANALVAVDATGKKLTYIGSGAGGGGISGGGVSFAIDSNGHIVVTGGIAPHLGTLASGFLAQSFIGTPNDVRMLVQITPNGSTAIVTGQALFTVTFGTAYASAPYVLVSPSQATAAASVDPISTTVSTSGFTVSAGLGAFTPSASPAMRFYIFVLS